MLLTEEQKLNAKYFSMNLAREIVSMEGDIVAEAEKIYQWIIKDVNARETK